MNDQEPTALEERVARHLAANDWIIDKGAASPWENRPAEFRNDYVAYAREVLAITREAEADAEASAAPRNLVGQSEKEAAATHARDCLDRPSVIRWCADRVRSTDGDYVIQAAAEYLDDLATEAEEAAEATQPKAQTTRDAMATVETALRDRIAAAIREFPFDDFGMDDVSYTLEAAPDSQEWVPKLADAVLAVLPDTMQ